MVLHGLFDTFLYIHAEGVIVRHLLSHLNSQCHMFSLRDKNILLPLA